MNATDEHGKTVVATCPACGAEWIGSRRDPDATRIETQPCSHCETELCDACPHERCKICRCLLCEVCAACSGGLCADCAVLVLDKGDLPCAA